MLDDEALEVVLEGEILLRIGVAVAGLPFLGPADALAAQPVTDGAPARRIFRGEDGRVHFMSAIPMAEQPCAMCHGSDIDPDLKAHIDSLYPDDAATGFEPGTLRGALLISWDAGSFGA